MILPAGVSIAFVAQGLGVPPDGVQYIAEVSPSFVVVCPLHYEQAVVVLTAEQQQELACDGAVLVPLPFLPPWQVTNRTAPWALFGTIHLDKLVPAAEMHARSLLIILGEPDWSRPA